MGRRFFDDSRGGKTVDPGKRVKVYDGRRTGKLGTESNPAAVRVQTEERCQEVEAIFKEKGWSHTIELDPDQPEDIIDLERLTNPPQPQVAEEKIGRNAPCPCGSGNKYKKCCGK